MTIDVQIDDVSMMDAPAAPPMPADPLPERAPGLSGATGADIANAETPPVVHMRRPEDDPRIALGKKSQRERNGRLLNESLSDPGTAEMTLAFAQPPSMDDKWAREALSDATSGRDARVAEAEDVELVVYGQKVTLDHNEVARRGGKVEAQKQLAADFQFRQAAQEREEAARILAEAEAVRNATVLLSNEIQNKMRPSTGAPTPAAALPAQADAADSGETIGQKLARGIFAGDMDSVAITLDNALSASASPTNLRALVDQTLEQRNADYARQIQAQQAQSAREQVNAHMRTVHADVITDPVLKAATLTAFELMRKDPANARFSAVEIADAAAQSVKARFNPGMQSPRHDPMEERRAVKQGMNWTPSAGQAPAAPAPAPRSRSSVVSRMRELRGQT